MGWGTNLLNEILGSFFGDSDKNDEAKFGYSRPCGHTNKNFRSDPLDEDIPEGKYTREEDRRKTTKSSGSNNNQYTQKTRTTQNTQSSPNTENSKTRYSRSNQYSRSNDYTDTDPYSNTNRYSNTNQYSRTNQYTDTNYNYNDDNDSGFYNSDSYYDVDFETWNDVNSSYSNNSEGSSNNSWDGYSKQNYQKDKSSKASQGFKRQHATQSKPGTYSYPTLSSKKSKTVKNDRALFTFGEPHFSTYDHGVRGIAFPYTLKVKNPKNRKIVVSGKFCSNTGTWIKSLVPEMADMYGDIVINESVVCIDSQFCIDSYLFLPYGVLSLKHTQKIYLNVDVFVDGPGPQHLLRYVHGFEYYIYENDPRETVTTSTSTFSDNKAGFEELIGLVAHVIKADGVCAPEEIRAVIEFFKKFKEIDKDFLKERLKYKLSNPSNLEKDCEVIKNSFNTQTRLVFLGFFFKIAVSDESVPSVEINMIEKISILLGIPKASFDSLSAEFLPASDKVWHLFGLTSKATKEQLKSAYRIKCKECHPDRFANASKEEYKKAEERFKELQDMYNFLLRKYSNL
jgi:uncharacterized tellurite resistance protein B-like protein